MTDDDTTQRKPGRPKADERERLSHVVQLRLNHRQRTYALMLAERQGCSLGEAIRGCIEQAIDEDPRTFRMDDEGPGLTTRQILAIIKPDDGWLTDRIAELEAE